jgi:hypothetical protein
MPVPPGSTKARKPTHLKILKGSFRPGRSNALEPKLPPETPIAPEALAADEKAVWAQFVDVIGPMRVATKQDFAAFQALVLCQTKIDRLEGRLRLDPDKKETYESVGKNGSMWRVKPEFTLLSELYRQLQGWLGRFGLTPGDRSRVSAGDNGKGKKRKEDEFAS